MTTLAANPRRLGAEIGGVAVPHTWGQALTHHPHIHCVVPGGGLSPDGTRWIASRPNFFLAVKPLSRLFRWLFLKRLIAAFNAGALRFFGDLASLAELDAFAGRIKAMQRVNWVVYAKRPFGGPAQVLAYRAATPIASRSPTAGSSHSTTIMSPSHGRTIAKTARQRS
jgi:hypothetical protein